MIVMPGNHAGWEIHYWQGRYGGLGQLYSPGRSWKPYPHLPYALDNGAYVAWSKKVPWDEQAFIAHCDRILQVLPKPLWVVVPDIVAHKEATIRSWDFWEPQLRKYQVPLAFAVQNGMEPADVPSSADVVFVGGTTEWKLANLEKFCSCFPRVHVGRVNTWKRLWQCFEAGAESCDGTGWFRGWKAGLSDLELFLKIQAGQVERSNQLTLGLEAGFWGPKIEKS